MKKTSLGYVYDLKYATGIQRDSRCPIVLQFMNGKNIILDTCWNVQDARSIASLLLDKVERHEKFLRENPPQLKLPGPGPISP